MSAPHALSILGLGSAQPDNVITNKFIEDLNVGTNEAWIVEKIGILERRTSLPISYIQETKNSNPRKALEVCTSNPTKLGIQATKEACKRAGIPIEKIGMVVANCCAPNDTAPTQAQRIAEALGLAVPAYDLFTACPAFALHIDFISRFREEEVPEYVLAVSTACVSQSVNYNDRSDGAIWGDGAAAAILSVKHKGKLKVTETLFGGDPTRASAVVVDTYGHFHQDGRAVRDFSVRQTVRLVKRLEEKHQLNWKKDIFIGHQANRTMLEQITGNREIPAENHWSNVTLLGNQAASGAPASLAMHWETLVPGQRICVAVLGAGLSWGSVLFEVQ